MAVPPSSSPSLSSPSGLSSNSMAPSSSTSRSTIPWEVGGLQKERADGGRYDESREGLVSTDYIEDRERSESGRRPNRGNYGNCLYIVGTWSTVNHLPRNIQKRIISCSYFANKE